jgi:hypothetical protein
MVVTRASTLILMLGLLAIWVLWMLLASMSAGITGLELLVGLVFLVIGGVLIYLRGSHVRATAGAK